MKIAVIGGGLAGTEAACASARLGADVTLFEMRPKKFTPAHKTPFLAELVCSNSLRSKSLLNAEGLLKWEMENLGSVIIRFARAFRVPAGKDLAVDRERFAKAITKYVESHPRIRVVREEVTEIPEGFDAIVIATGPLTSSAFAEVIRRITGEKHLYFYDAVAPIVYTETVNMSKAFWGARYGEGEGFLNCPMTEEEFERFYQALVSAEVAPLHDFEKGIYYEACLPIEETARRGKKTLLYGPLRPVGLVDPRTGKQPFAVVQLRRENKEGTLLGMVGFQTRLKWGEQKRVFRLIPALERAEFARFGVMHRNTYINSPKLLLPTLQLKKNPRILFAGQITGTEGYIESAATGILAGINAVLLARGKKPLVPPPETIIGALVRYITSANPDSFQPMGANWGIVPPLEKRIRDKRKRREELAKRGQNRFREFWASAGLNFLPF